MSSESELWKTLLSYYAKNSVARPDGKRHEVSSRYEKFRRLLVRSKIKPSEIFLPLGSGRCCQATAKFLLLGSEIVSGSRDKWGFRECERLREILPEFAHEYGLEQPKTPRTRASCLIAAFLANLNSKEFAVTMDETVLQNLERFFPFPELMQFGFRLSSEIICEVLQCLDLGPPSLEFPAFDTMALPHGLVRKLKKHPDLEDRLSSWHGVLGDLLMGICIGAQDLSRFSLQEYMPRRGPAGSKSVYWIERILTTPILAELVRRPEQVKSKQSIVEIAEALTQILTQILLEIDWYRVQFNGFNIQDLAPRIENEYWEIIGPIRSISDRAKRKATAWIPDTIRILAMLGNEYGLWNFDPNPRLVLKGILEQKAF